MSETNHSSRRSFLLKIAAGSVGLATSSGVAARALQEKPGVAAINSPGASDKKFVPVMITPYKKDGQIDYDGVSKLMDFYLAAGVKGFFANCLSSEMYSITEDERLELTQHIVRYVNGRAPVVATGSFG